MTATDAALYRECLTKREARLRRLLLYRHDGHGCELNDVALRLVASALRSTERDWWESFEAEVQA